MKKLVVLALALGCMGSAFSQLDSDTEKKLKDRKPGNSTDSLAWNAGGIGKFNFTQTAMSNWAGGGQNSVSGQTLVSLFANYAQGNLSWDNTFDASYGLIKQGRADFFKNDDRIELNSKFGYKASENWYYSALLNFRSQFNYGYTNANDPDTAYISNILAPSYTIGALGFDYKPNDGFTAFISPATIKVTTVMDDRLSAAGAFGVDPGETIRTELGGYLKVAYKKDKPLGMEDVVFQTNISLFSNYMESPENVDVTWETLTSFQLKPFLALSFSTYLIYDHDVSIARFNDDGSPQHMLNDDGVEYLDGDGNFIQAKGPAVQFKQVLAIGLTKKF